MDPNKRRLIGQLADQVRNELKLGVPTDVRSAVNVLGGKIQEMAFDDMAYEAAVRKINDRNFEIRLRDGVGVQRERFSVAHELGHLFIHMGFQTDEQKWNGIQVGESSERTRYGVSESEYEANEFAAALLMPEDSFRQAVDELAIDNKIDMSKVAERFGVSIAAARLRGQWLGLISWD
ncbi:MAG: ImmA/IrrE family metallo-endopeptidase [Magnetococcus sp. DMHC-1]